MPAGLAEDGAFAACVTDAAQRELAGKEAFQRGMRDLIVAQKPELEALASLSMRLQVAYAQARAVKYTYLLKHDPARIQTDKGLVKFLNFDWSAADDAAFAQESAEARQLLARIADLRKDNDGHPDWPKMREFMRAELSSDPAFRALMARLSENGRAVTAGIEACRRG